MCSPGQCQQKMPDSAVGKFFIQSYAMFVGYEGVLLAVDEQGRYAVAIDKFYR